MRPFRREPAPEPAPAPTAYEVKAARVARFDALCHAVFLKGAHFRRDFGDWVRLRLADGTYLELDSYGRNLMVKEGSGEYPPDSEGHYGGFVGRNLYKVGIHFGSPEVYVDDAVLAALAASVATAPDQGAEGDSRVYTRRTGG